MGNLFIVAHIPSIAFISSYTHVHLQWQFGLSPGITIAYILPTACALACDRFFENKQSILRENRYKSWNHHSRAAKLVILTPLHNMCNSCTKTSVGMKNKTTFLLLLHNRHTRGTILAAPMETGGEQGPQMHGPLSYLWAIPPINSFGISFSPYVMPFTPQHMPIFIKHSGISTLRHSHILFWDTASINIWHIPYR